MVSDENFEKELYEFLEKETKAYLEFNQIVDENELVDFIVNKSKDFTVDWAIKHPDIVLGKVFGEEVVKNSRIDVQCITGTYDIANKISAGIEGIIELDTIGTNLEIYYDAKNISDVNASNKAVQDMTVGFLSITKIVMDSIPLSGSTYGVLVESLNLCFQAEFNLTTKRLAQIQYTEIMCEYYSGNLDANELVYEMSQIYNLSDEYKAKVIALVTMETKFDGIDIEQEETFQYQKDSWIAKGQEIYGLLSEEEKEIFGDWLTSRGWNTQYDERFRVN